MSITAPPEGPMLGFDPVDQLKAFNTAFEVMPYCEEPDALGRRNNAKLSLKLITEEFEEVRDELLDVMNNSGDYAHLAKELADLLYVVYQAAVKFEIPIERVFTAVHESNMSKLGTDGKPVRRSDGKVLKGPNYREPDIESILYGVS